MTLAIRKCFTGWQRSTVQKLDHGDRLRNHISAWLKSDGRKEHACTQG
ncbi:hypothetical protein E0500_030410 [Streptomyces sp. KM273126]|nr:hypothetical protein [Streptomyces sp. KM273126]MBA2811530.1 hypothetical protein [Streptomyces sp. KM273126]